MPPKKPSTPLPKGQASLSNFFGSKGTGSSPASSQEARASIRNPPAATTPTKNASASSTSSKYFASKKSSATKADPMVIDDSDDDDLDLKPPPKSTAKASNGSMARTSPRKSATKRKTYDEDSDDDFVDNKKGNAGDDDDEDDFAPAPKRPATTSAKAKAGATSQPPRRAAANAKPIKIDDSDDDDDFEDAPPPPKKAAASSSKKASPAKPPAKAAAKPAASKQEDDDFVEPAAPAPAAGNKSNWREMAAKRAAGPSNPGSKEIPQGAPNCLAGLTLVFTGELSSISRDEATDLAKRYGARITGAPSSKTSFVVVGEGAGPKKIASIEKNKIATLDEDGFLELIRTRGAGELDEKTKQKIKAEEEKIKEVARSMGPPKDTSANPVDLSNMLWTSKYAPTQMKDLVGNKAAVEKLAGWLKAWPDSYRSNFKKPGPTGMNVYRAVLISGPPGIGKTTSAHLVAKMEGYVPLEFNASDTRGKKVVENMLQDTINNKSLDSWYTSVTHSAQSDLPRIHERTVLIMDEVDGMSGGDRGGVGAINALIKKTKVPIICICNDRRNQKMRPFEHTTYNLSFRKPDANQVKSRMLSIAFKEKLKIPGEVMAQLIEAAQSDIRSVINMLSTWKLSNDTMDFDESKRLGLENSKPGLHTPFSLYSELSSPGMFNATSKKTLNDKADLYFQDHSFVPLMVAENYAKARPVLASRESGPRQQLKHLELLRKAAASISDGDVVDRMIHGSEQHWSLMPLHAIASSVRPCSYIYGGTEGGFPSFPAWLGQNSKQQRLTRAVVDLQAKMRLVCSGSRHDVRQHYLPSLWGRLIHPMVHNGAEGVDEVIDLMDEYYLAIEDRESILELGLEPNNAEAVLKSIPAPVKAGFTRKYNATSHPIAFNKASDVGAKMKVAKAEVPDLEDAVEEEVVEDEKEDEKEGDEDDLAKDKLVKKPKAGGGAKGKGKAKGKK